MTILRPLLRPSILRLFALFLANGYFLLPAGAGQPDLTDRVNFMAGTYILIGRVPDSKATYTGTIVFRAHGQKLDFTRTVAGHTQRGTAVFDTVAGADRIPVLRLQFTQDGRHYAGTYQWYSDYDNYSRFTGFIYLPKGSTEAAGLEAFFPRDTAVSD